MKCNFSSTLPLWLASLMLASCGGSPGQDDGQHDDKFLVSISTSAEQQDTTASTDPTRPRALGSPSSTTVATAAAALPPAEAAHFLAQATFGPNMTGIAELVASGKSNWLNEQFARPQTPHRLYVQRISSTLANGMIPSQTLFFESFWMQALTARDQLRQRTAFALSEIFVVSLVDSQLYGHTAGAASYYDMLGQHAFGNFRDLLQGVALHPMMGLYLSHMRNQKEDGPRVPDENFAREIMQLMTIGLYELNQDGTQKLSAGKPIPTYTHDDVAGLAKVFTGWSWGGPDKSMLRFFGAAPYAARDWTPMQSYPAYHSTSDKKFLGVTVGGGGTAESDLKIALDTLFNHPNVGPFIGKQLIQRLVTSNPSPEYVGRVAAAFANNGSGVRGDMKAVLRAVLLAPEAADNGNAKKLREPVLRLANWMRAFNAKSQSGRFLLVSADDPLTNLGQTPMRSPSVFNFFRPSYTPPNSSLSTSGMVAPEMQITGEPSVTGYLNYMLSAVAFGVGTNHDIVPEYGSELNLASTPELLLDRVQLLLLNGTMSSGLRRQILDAMNAVYLPPKATSNNVEQIANAKKNRVYLAIFLTMASPEYIAQR